MTRSFLTARWEDRVLWGAESQGSDNAAGRRGIGMVWIIWGIGGSKIREGKILWQGT
jgi:hypothetical protein